jgi:hypothetical protein
MDLDVFKADGFSLTALSKAVSDVAFLPTRLAGLFSAEPITTTNVMIESEGETLALLPAKPRGAPATVHTPDRRKMRTLNSVHLPVEVSVLADEVQQLRAFGSESDVATARAWLMRKMMGARRKIDLTLEYHRVGAIRGQVLDSDGSSVLLDLFNEFGITKPTLAMALGTAGTKVNQKAVTIKRMVEDALGGLPYDSITVECSPEFFESLVTHAAVEEAYNDYLNKSFKREDQRDGFPLATNVFFREYRGKVGSNQFIPANKAQVVPNGVPDLFVQHFAPAPYVETVNTMGLPFYSKMEEMKMGKGYEVEMQSNPLTFCTRPGVLIELSA